MTYGYATVNFVGVDFNAAAAKTVSGLHKQLTNAVATKKPILGYNLVDDTTAFTPMPVVVTKSGTTFTVYALNETFTVSSADSVTITTV